MTDFDRFKEFCEKAGIAYDRPNYSGAGLLSTGISVDSCEKVKGYSGFYADFIFNHDGSLAEMGIWE